ncbi:MAG TPA: lantibiotic dehydratase, partial [Ktedonobacteraceae bacterium]|nr:lantibiotic dehydratase [Ktedonobacteraceae bacterium]
IVPLQELHTYLVCYPTMRAFERFELLERISTTIERICQQLASPQTSDESTAELRKNEPESGPQAKKNYWREIQALNKNTIYEDTMVAAIDGQYAQALWQQPVEDLALIQRLSGLYTVFLSSQLATTTFFVDHYGAGANVKLLHFYEAFCKERHQAGGWRTNYRVSGAHLSHMLEQQTVPHSLRLPELDQVLALRQEIYRWMEGQAVDEDGVRRLDPARLHAFVANFPLFVIPPRSLAFYCQTLLRDDIPSLVLNALHSGFGRSRARLQRLESLISGESQSDSQRVEAPILIDIAGAFNSNVNLRVAQTAYEIAYPGVVSACPPEEQLPLTDLSIMYDPHTRRLQLLSERLGQAVLPVHLGLMADFWLPALSRFLLRTFSVGPANPTPFSLRPLDLSPFEAERPIKYYPRLAIGRVIIERATWIVSAAYLPRHEKGASLFAYLLCLQRWLRTHGLPQQCFVRVLFDSPAVDKNRKPLYIDFSNHLGVMMFEQLVNQTKLALLLQEVLPDQPDLAISDGVAFYASECIFELTLKEGR